MKAILSWNGGRLSQRQRKKKGRPDICVGYGPALTASGAKDAKERQ